jgi:16S rRNA (adenine1518-N6/adenine1519-N6)-dimethyltransferase
VERVLEIGPGLGALTEELLKRTEDYYCVELEPAFLEYIRKRFRQLPPERLICADIRKVDPKVYRKTPERLVVVSNLPYSVSSDVLLWIFEHRAHIRSASLLLQREFAERVAATPGSRRYGILSVYAAMYGAATLGSIVPGSAFVPEVDVDSRLLNLELLEEPRYPVCSDVLFRKVVRQAFSQRRKTLANSLGKSALFESRDAADALFKGLNIDSTRRPETFSAEEYVAIANALAGLSK